MNSEVIQPWFIYLIRDDSQALYCGITTDVSRRFEQHQSGKGAKYFRGKKNLSLVWQQNAQDRATASRIEAHIKQLSKAQKESLVVNCGSISLPAR